MKEITMGTFSLSDTRKVGDDFSKLRHSPYIRLFRAAFLTSLLSNASNPDMGVDFLSKVCNPRSVMIYDIQPLDQLFFKIAVCCWLCTYFGLG